MADEVDGVALEVEPDVGVGGGGDADVGVIQQFLDHDEFHSSLQEEGGCRVAEVVEPDGVPLVKLTSDEVSSGGPD